MGNVFGNIAPVMGYKLINLQAAGLCESGYISRLS